jgi:DNA-binding MarR family transcriptional regulator
MSKHAPRTAAAASGGAVAPSSGARAAREVAADASALRIHVMRLARRLRSERAAGGLTPSQLAVLGRLERDGDASSSELARAERVRPQSMAKTVALLEDAGLVGRVPHATDRRQVVLSLTDVGRELLAQDRAAREAWLARAMSRELDERERALLIEAGELLDRLASSR